MGRRGSRAGVRVEDSYAPGAYSCRVPNTSFFLFCLALSLSLLLVLSFSVSTPRIDRHARTVKLPAHVGPLISCATRGTAQRRVDGERFSAESLDSEKFLENKNLIPSGQGVVVSVVIMATVRRKNFRK